MEHRPNGISTYKTYNARNQITELTNQCDDCGWVLGHYIYTYDNRGYIVGEHAEEAREMDPYGRERYTLMFRRSRERTATMERISPCPIAC